MRKLYLTLIFSACISISGFGQEAKMDCLMYAKQEIPCLLTPFKKVSDTLCAIAPANCNAYSFDPSANGVWKIFAPDSTTLIEITGVEDGKRNGFCRDYYPNGKQRTELLYWQGSIDQSVRSYYWDNGRTARFEAHTSSIGRSEYFDKDGHEIDAATFLSLWCK